MLYRGNGTEVCCSSTWCFIVVVLFYLQQNNQLSWTAVYAFSRNATESAELMTNYESSLSLSDILPIPPRQYDKNRAPKLLGQPTVVYFHVTVLSLDSINEESMVTIPTWNFNYTHTYSKEKQIYEMTQYRLIIFVFWKFLQGLLKLYSIESFISNPTSKLFNAAIYRPAAEAFILPPTQTELFGPSFFRSRILTCACVYFRVNMTTTIKKREQLNICRIRLSYLILVFFFICVRLCSSFDCPIILECCGLIEPSCNIISTFLEWSWIFPNIIPKWKLKVCDVP